MRNTGTTKTRPRPAALKRGDVLLAYSLDEGDLTIVGFADNRTKLRVRSDFTGQVRVIDNDVAKLRRRYRLPDRFRRTGSQDPESGTRFRRGR